MLPLLVKCFNSMKVRLKQGGVDSALASQLFQFHEGPIKTGINPYNAASSGQMFQFHEGPIKTMLEKQQTWSEQSFNSMKVRLKQKVEALTRNLSPFQFHEGPIKTTADKEQNGFDHVSIP